jgi:hypothetical protein
MGWAGHAVCIKKIMNAYRFFGSKSEGKSQWHQMRGLGIDCRITIKWAVRSCLKKRVEFL